MSFDDDAAETLRTHLECWGETIVYKPLGGLPRPVVAIVDRDPPASLAIDPTMVAPRLVVTVLSDALEGILPDELDAGGDQIEVALRKGGTATSRPILRLAEGDSGGTTFWVN